MVAKKGLLLSRNNWAELAQEYLLHTGNRLSLTLVRGEGTKVWDEEGKEYLDFVAGWAVNSLGHCHPVIVKVLTEQAQNLIQASNQFYTIPQIRLAQLLAEHSCFQKAFFSNSGAEANEGAVKLARKYGKLYLDSAFEVITAFNSFHGRTLAMVAATGQPKFQQPYTPLPLGFVNVEYDNIEAIKSATTKQTCAVMLEPIQGEGGVNVPHDDYLPQVREWCDQNGILLILDEVQTGIGRTGRLFAYQHSGIEPDIITLGKGLGGGVPIGAILTKEKTAVFEPGDHGSTFGGNPLATAVAFAVLEFILKNELPRKVQKLGQYFIARLEGLKSRFSFINEVRGRGLLLAIEFNQEIAEQLVMACLERRLLVNRIKPNTLRFMPPLIISEADIDQAVAILAEVLATIRSG
jgi:predicted acetylornithine/succinylornithine family transaminase